MHYKKLIHFIAFGFGSGLLPKAPGTFGTLAAVPFYLVLNQLPSMVYFIFLILAAFFGIWICDVTARSLKVPDHPSIVWDEMVGFWITMFAAPYTLFSLILGFALFRFFDIVKPWPIRWFDRHVKGGFGIMMDDMLAGVCASILLQMIFWVLRKSSL